MHGSKAPLIIQARRLFKERPQIKLFMSSESKLQLSLGLFGTRGNAEGELEELAGARSRELRHRT